jgi:hypothetical protein
VVFPTVTTPILCNNGCCKGAIANNLVIWKVKPK